MWAGTSGLRASVLCTWPCWSAPLQCCEATRMLKTSLPLLFGTHPCLVGERVSGVNTGALMALSDYVWIAKVIAMSLLGLFSQCRAWQVSRWQSRAYYQVSRSHSHKAFQHSINEEGCLSTLVYILWSCLLFCHYGLMWQEWAWSEHNLRQISSPWNLVDEQNTYLLTHLHTIWQIKSHVHTKLQVSLPDFTSRKSTHLKIVISMIML